MTPASALATTSPSESASATVRQARTCLRSASGAGVWMPKSGRAIGILFDLEWRSEVDGRDTLSFWQAVAH